MPFKDITFLAFICVSMFICCIYYKEVSRKLNLNKLEPQHPQYVPQITELIEDRNISRVKGSVRIKTNARVESIGIKQHHTVVTIVNSNYHLATCQIEKVMTTIRDGIFCYLSDPQNFTMHNRSISREHWKNRYCSRRRYLRSNMTAVLNHVGEQPVLFSVVREPVDRFLSGFLDKCIFENDYDYDTSNVCYGCVDDIHCFVDELHRRLLGLKKETKRESYYSRHFAPQTWYCDFLNYLRNYTIIKYEKGKEGGAKMAEQFDTIFKRARVPDTMREVIHKEILKGTTSHSTHSSEESRRLKEIFFSDKNLVQKVVQIYYYDFIVFHFPFPQL